MRDVHAMLAEIPRLEASESLRGMTVAAMGFGALKREDSARLLRSWQRAAAADRPTPRVDHARMATLMGMRVVREPAPPTAEVPG